MLIRSHKWWISQFIIYDPKEAIKGVNTSPLTEFPWGSEANLLSTPPHIHGPKKEGEKGNYPDFLWLWNKKKTSQAKMWNTYVCVCAQLCPTLWNPMDCSLPGFSIQGIFQTRILEWVAIPFSRGSSWLSGQTCVSCFYSTGRWTLYHWAPWEAHVWFTLTLSREFGEKRKTPSWRKSIHDLIHWL